MLYVPRFHVASCTRRGPLRALIQSLAAVLFFTAVLGFVFLPRELHRWREGQHVTVSSCCVLLNNEPQLASLFWVSPMQGTAPVRWNLAVHEGGNWTELNFDWTQSRLTCLAASAETGELYAGDTRGTIFAFDPQRPRQEPRSLGRQSEGVTELVASRDGRFVVSTDMTSVYAWDPAAGGLRWRRDGLPATCLAIDAAGGKLLCGTTGGDLLEIDLATGETKRVLARLDGPIRSADVSASGELAACVDSTCQVRLLRADSGQSVWPANWTSEFAGPITAAQFSPCGRLLVTAPANSSRGLGVWSVESGRRLAELHGHTAHVVGLSFAGPNALYSWGTDGSIRTWDLALQSSEPSLSLASYSRL